MKSVLEGKAEVAFRVGRTASDRPSSDIGLEALSLNEQPRRATSLRKACFAESLGERGEVLRSAKWCQISEIGDAQIGIKFERPCDAYLCWLKPPGERIAGCGYADRQQESRIVAH